MALSLGARRGFKWSIGRDILRVKEIVDAHTIIVTVNKNKDYTITDMERTEVLPNVFVQCGVGEGVFVQEGNSRLAIEAPRDILIERVKASVRIPRFGFGEGGQTEPSGA